MGGVRTHDAEEGSWRAVRDWAPAAIQAQISDLELGSSIREHERGDEAAPQLFEVKFLPDTLVDVHAHDEEEIMYVVAGEMWLGSRRLGPGSSVYVPGSVFYSFRAGPEGLRVLNFRPRRDSSYRTKITSRRRGNPNGPASPEAEGPLDV